MSQPTTLEEFLQSQQQQPRADGKMRSSLKKQKKTTSSSSSSSPTTPTASSTKRRKSRKMTKNKNKNHKKSVRFATNPDDNGVWSVIKKLRKYSFNRICGGRKKNWKIVMM